MSESELLEIIKGIKFMAVGDSIEVHVKINGEDFGLGLKDSKVDIKQLTDKLNCLLRAAVYRIDLEYKITENKVKTLLNLRGKENVQ